MSKLIGIQHQILPALRRAGYPRHDYFQVSGTRTAVLELGHILDVDIDEGDDLDDERSVLEEEDVISSDSELE